ASLQIGEESLADLRVLRNGVQSDAPALTRLSELCAERVTQSGRCRDNVPLRALRVGQHQPWGRRQPVIVMVTKGCFESRGHVAFVGLETGDLTASRDESPPVSHGPSEEFPRARLPSD